MKKFKELNSKMNQKKHSIISFIANHNDTDNAIHLKKQIGEYNPVKLIDSGSELTKEQEEQIDYKHKNIGYGGCLLIAFQKSKGFDYVCFITSDIWIPNYKLLLEYMEEAILLPDFGTYAPSSSGTTFMHCENGLTNSLRSVSCVEGYFFLVKRERLKCILANHELNIWGCGYDFGLGFLSFIHAEKNYIDDRIHIYHKAGASYNLKIARDQQLQWYKAEKIPLNYMGYFELSQKFNGYLDMPLRLFFRTLGSMYFLDKICWYALHTVRNFFLLMKRSVFISRKKALPNSNLYLLIGMCGTGSATLSNVLRLMGLKYPSKINKSDFYNPLGSFEDHEIVCINDEILAFYNLQWNSRSLGEINYKILPNKLRCKLKNRLRSVYGKGEKMFIKDFRISLLIDLYREILQEIELPVCWIETTRDSDEIAKFLNESYSIPIFEGLRLVKEYEEKKCVSNLDIHVSVDLSHWKQHPEETLNTLVNEMGFTLCPQNKNRILEFIEAGKLQWA